MGGEIKRREMALKHTQVRNEGCLHLHRQPPPLSVEDSIAWQLGASPNTLGITLQQQHLFSREQKAGGDASFYSFYAVLHHTQSLWDRLARRITLCNDSLVPLKRAAALEEAAAHEPVSCTLCNAGSWVAAGGPWLHKRGAIPTQRWAAKQPPLSSCRPWPGPSRQTGRTQQ